MSDSELPQLGNVRAARPIWRKKRWLLPLVALLLLALLMLSLWLLRYRIADNYIQDALTKADVRARYELTELGFGRQRLRNLVIGDPNSPDLTAEEVIVATNVGFNGVDVRSVTAHHVRLYGAIMSGKLTLGEVDKLLPKPTGEPFELPDINVMLDDGRMRLATPAGVIGMRLDGQGNIANGFRGKLAAMMPQGQASGCRFTRASAYVDVATDAKRPAIKGPVRLASLNCPERGIAANTVNVALDAGANATLDQFTGDALIDAASADQGSNKANSLVGSFSFDGSVKAVEGSFDLAAKDAIAGGQSLGKSAIEGDYQLAFAEEGVSGTVDGAFGVGQWGLGREHLAFLDRLSAGSGGTPVKELAERLSAATKDAAASMSAKGSFGLTLDPSGGEFRVTSMNAQSRSGAKLTFVGDKGLNISWPRGRGFGLSGTLTLSGGGLPQGHAVLTQNSPGAPMIGIVRLQPYSAGNSRLAFAPIRFSSDAVGNTRFDTQVTLSGPVPGGQLTNAVLPVTGGFSRDGLVAINRGCTPLRFDALNLSGVKFTQQSLNLCPDEGDALYRRFANGNYVGGVRVAQPRLNGMTGQTPLSIAADGFSVGIRQGIFGAQKLKVRLGRGDDPVRLDIGQLTGDFRGGGLQGQLSDVSGKISKVPLLISKGTGDWRLKGTTLTVQAALTVDDEQREPTPRFMTLESRDFALTFAGSRIDATGTLIDPVTGRPITRVVIGHHLNSGAGRADLFVDRLVIDDSLEVPRLTPLAKGIVAEVQGAVTGKGQIRWDSNGVSSDGTFNTDKMDLSAAFGPVKGINGTIHFTDLLALKTAPGQVVELAEVNPGIAVVDGKIRYQLLPGPMIQIEGGEWPFSDGTLSLEPTLLEFGIGKNQLLNFRVRGLDAAAFLQSFEFENINATGVFDGVLPIVFENGEGFVRGGRLEAREGGGNIAYVGVLTQEDLGYFGNIAFQALKAIEYRDLIIELNGPLAGNMVTSLKFDGLAQGKGVTNNFITKQLAKLPFQFNITINAPFQQLLSSARSFYDPTVLVERNLGLLQQNQYEQSGDIPPPPPAAPEDQKPKVPAAAPDANLPPKQPSVQPPESENNL